MPSLSFLRHHSSGANAWVGAWVMAAASLVSGAQAASINGVANATVIGDVVSQPIVIRLQTPAPQAGAVVSQPVVIRLQTPQADVRAFPIRLGFTVDQTTRNNGVFGGGSGGESPGAGASFGITLIDVDAAGVARFSVAGAGATSGYVVQFPTSIDTLLSQSPSASDACSADVASNRAQGCDAKTGASLIVPSQALTGGSRLAVEVSQALGKLLSGELSVQVNYN